MLLCGDGDDDAIVYLKERLNKIISLRASLNSSWHAQLSTFIVCLSSHLTLRPFGVIINKYGYFIIICSIVVW